MTTSQVIDRATKFGERFGFPALVAIMLIAGLMYGIGFVLKYEVLFNREQVEAMSTEIEYMSHQHETLLLKSEASIELQSKQVCIACAACWNAATNSDEIKRCSCHPCE